MYHILIGSRSVSARHPCFPARAVLRDLRMCLSFFPNRGFISYEPNLCLRAPRSTGLPKINMNVCVCACVCAFHCFIQIFFCLNSVRMFISLHPDRYPWRNHQSEVSIGPLPAVTLQTGALVPRCCLESINRRCIKVTLLLQCCTISL